MLNILHPNKFIKYLNFGDLRQVEGYPNFIWQVCLWRVRKLLDFIKNVLICGLSGL